MTRLLIIHPALVPYRIDLFNFLFDSYDTELLLLYENAPTQHFDQEALASRLRKKPNLLAFHELGGRRFPCGLARRVDAFRPDCVLTSEFSPATLITAVLKAAPWRQFAHLVMTDDDPESIAGDSRGRQLARHIAKSCIDGWVFTSGEAERLYRQRFRAAQPAACMPIIHDDGSFRAALSQAEDEVDRQASLFNLGKEKVVLYVGRLEEIKSLHLLLRSFALATQLTDTVLAIVGDGTLRAQLHALASELGIATRVKFVGRREGQELMAWFRIGDVFALSSRFEQFGAVVNEALLAGMPAVVSKHAGARSLIRPGESGDIIDPMDTQAFAAAIQKWLSASRSDHYRGALRPNLMHRKFSEYAGDVRELVDSLSRRSRMQAAAS